MHARASNLKVSVCVRVGALDMFSRPWTSTRCCRTAVRATKGPNHQPTRAPCRAWRASWAPRGSRSCPPPSR
eukprot:6424704-Alexandrium_andersonii.AAC.1